MVNNVLIVAQGHNHERLYSRSLGANSLCWVSGAEPRTPLSCSAKTRYRQPDQSCTITEIKHGVCQVMFDEPQWAVTPGQSVVFYQGAACLGGGIIEHTSQ